MRSLPVASALDFRIMRHQDFARGATGGTGAATQLVLRHVHVARHPPAPHRPARLADADRCGRHRPPLRRRRGPSSVSSALADKRLERQLVVDPQLALGEAYMHGRLKMSRAASTTSSSCSSPTSQRQPLPRWTESLDAARYLCAGCGSSILPDGRRRNVAHHYDIDGAIYDLFLDATGSIPAPTSRRAPILEEAQLAKKRHLAAKLAIEPGQRVLDIGSGWGGLGLYLAKAADCDVTGVTLSNEQLEDLQRARGQGGLEPRGALRAQGLPQGRGPLRPHRLGRHVRARRRQPLRHLLPQGARAAEPTTAWR